MAEETAGCNPVSHHNGIHSIVALELSLLVISPLRHVGPGLMLPRSVGLAKTLLNSYMTQEKPYKLQSGPGEQVSEGRLP